MKPRAVLFNLWNKHFPVIKAFAEANPDYLIVVPHSGFRNLPLFAGFSGRIIPFDAFATDADRGPLSMRALEMASFLSELPSRPVWGEFCATTGVPPRETAEALFQDAGPRLFELIVQVECLERVRERLDIRLAVLNEENTLLPRSMVAWAKSKGLPVLHINHSLGMSGWYTVHGKIASDALAVYGPIAMDGPMETGLTADRIFISGNPDWLVYGRPEAMKPSARAEVLARLFPGPEAPLIVFGTTFSANLTATEEKKDTSASAIAFFRAIAAVRKTGRRIHCAVKLRPNNDKSFEDEYIRLATGEGLGPGDYLFVRTDLEKLLLAADALVSVDSTLSADALLADTLAINLVTEEGWRRGPYYPGYTGILECRNEDLAACLVEALEDASLQERSRILRRRSRTAFQGTPPGGDPTAFLAGLIAQMAQRQALPGESVPEAAQPGEDWRAALPGSRDYIDLGNLLETCADPQKVLAAAADILSPTGEIACSIINVSHAPVLRALIQGDWPAPEDRAQIRFFTLAGLTSLLSEAGFRIITSSSTPSREPEDAGLLGLLGAMRPSRSGSLDHVKVQGYSVTAGRIPASAPPGLVLGAGAKLFPSGSSPKMAVVIRPAAVAADLKECLQRLAGLQSLETEYICMVPAACTLEARSFLPVSVSLVEAEGRALPQTLLRRLAGSGRADCFAILDPGVRLGSGWDLRMVRHLAPNSAVGPLVDQIAGTQSIYHYLNASRVDPEAVEALAREVYMRYPALEAASDWLYDQVLVLDRGALSAISGISDEKPDTHFLGIGRKLRLTGARLLVAKDVYSRW